MGTWGWWGWWGWWGSSSSSSSSPSSPSSWSWRSKLTNILALPVLYPYVFKGMCTHIKVESSKLLLPISSISEGDKPLVQILIQMDCNTFLAVVLMFYLSIPTFLMETEIVGEKISILGHGVCAVHWALQLMNSDRQWFQLDPGSLVMSPFFTSPNHDRYMVYKCLLDGYYKVMSNSPKSWDIYQSLTTTGSGRGIYGIMTAHFWRCFDQDLSSPSWVIEQCLQRLTRGPLLNMDTREDWGPLEFFGLWYPILSYICNLLKSK